MSLESSDSEYTDPHADAECVQAELESVRAQVQVCVQQLRRACRRPLELARVG